MQNGTHKCSSGGGGGGGGKESVRVGLINYPCCFQAGIESRIMHIRCARRRLRRTVKVKEKSLKAMERCEGNNPFLDF